MDRGYKIFARSKDYGDRWDITFNGDELCQKEMEQGQMEKAQELEEDLVDVHR